MRFSTCCFLLIFVPLLISCEEDGPVKSDLPTPSLVDNCRVADEQTIGLLDIDGDIEIGVGLFSVCIDVGFAGGDPLLVGIVQISDKEYASISYSILNEFTVSPGKLEITLLNIQRPDVTADQIGPATTVSLFDMPDGVYLLDVILGSQTDTYSVLVADTGVSLAVVSTSFTRLGNSFSAR